jgi:hypothetical protein
MQDASKPATIDNLVLVTHAEADEHDERPGGLEALRRQVTGAERAAAAAAAGS